MDMHVYDRLFFQHMIFPSIPILGSQTFSGCNNECYEERREAMQTCYKDAIHICHTDMQHRYVMQMRNTDAQYRYAIEI